MYHALPAPCWGRAMALMIDDYFHSFIVIMSLPLSFASCMSHSPVLAFILCLCTSLFCHSSPCLSCPRDLWGWGCLCLACCLLLLCLLDPEHTHVIMSHCHVQGACLSSVQQLGTDWSPLVPGIAPCPHA